MKIWIDLANSPQVPFFVPLIHELTRREHELFVTLRDYAETVALAQKYGIAGETVGRHGGGGRLAKIPNLLGRALQLRRSARGKGMDLATCHNSPTHIIAGRMIGARVVNIMDFEGQPSNHLAFRAAHKVIVPESFPDRDLRRLGARPSRVYKYAGFKEQVYLSSFQPEPSFPGEVARACGLQPDWDPTSTVLVTIRTAPTQAAYHAFENPLFSRLLDKVNAMPELTVIALPRNPGQREEIRTRYPNLHLLEQPLDGSNLMALSDLVISGGGTMNREAAILGTPAYTIFAGRLPAVDQALIDMGRMQRLTTEGQVEGIAFEKKEARDVLRNHGLCAELVREVVA